MLLLSTGCMVMVRHCMRANQGQGGVDDDMNAIHMVVWGLSWWEAEGLSPSA